MSNTAKRRIVFPTNTNDIEKLYTRTRYIFDNFGNEPFTIKDLKERYSENPVLNIDVKTIQSTFSSLYSFKLFKKIDNKHYQITNFGREFARGILEEETEYYNNFLIKINENYTYTVREQEIYPFRLLLKTFYDLNGIVYKHELCPFFFISNEEEYNNYINIIKQSREEHDNEIVVNYIQNLIEENKIDLDDVKQVVKRDISLQMKLLITLGFVNSNIVYKSKTLEFPGGFKTSPETYYEFTEYAYSKYFSEEELLEIHMEKINNISTNVVEEDQPFNKKAPARKRTVSRTEIPRNKSVQAYVIKNNDTDFFESIESPYGHPAPNIGGKPGYEVHHTVPLEFQDKPDFQNKNLDVSMLCILICTICHKILHDNKNGERELKIRLVQHMYEHKKDDLRKYAGIQSYEEFARLYNL